MAEDFKFTKFQVLEFVLAKDEDNKNLLEKVKQQSKAYEVVVNEVSLQV